MEPRSVHEIENHLFDVLRIDFWGLSAKPQSAYRTNNAKNGDWRMRTRRAMFQYERKSDTTTIPFSPLLRQW
ncbi:hypothetical protein M378DRAFT_165720 [Amanita muscaria Koide BX008]|uniref:Uncharacterized protein n=1 Tax=Amanita muscaria (strain Koide BX008) TaxID=946122 RepID=A0A0C2SHC4_AMAMK|nr:hypothetical protein M378DRAFT_167857 [Amanita muscaria Koide BX008]KIL62515.1 hypothetical protein M378DRAFT_165720 [Amanita muscaria Koide BX008]